MNKLKVKVEVEKELVIPRLIKSEVENDNHCILDNKFSFACCDEIPCDRCICNIDNLNMLADSQNLQLL